MHAERNVTLVAKVQPSFSNRVGQHGTLFESIVMFSSDDLDQLVSAIRNYADEARFVYLAVTGRYVRGSPPHAGSK